MREDSSDGGCSNLIGEERTLRHQAFAKKLEKLDKACGRPLNRIKD
jgi:hypothetical protein